MVEMGLEWLSEAEKTYFQRIISTELHNDPSSKGLSNLLVRSGLPLQVTHDILALADKLPTHERALAALKYVALAQARKLLKPSNLSQKVNLPWFNGVHCPQLEESDSGSKLSAPLPAARGTDSSRAKYLDEAFQESPAKVLLRPVQSKFVPSEEDLPSPTEAEEEHNAVCETDLLDFTESAQVITPPRRPQQPAESYSQPDLLSDYFIPPTKNSIARGGNKAFVFPTEQGVDTKAKPQGAVALANRLPSFPTRDLAHRSQLTVEKPLTAKDVLENEGELNKLKGKLIQFMRLEEAEKCQEHIELIAKIRQISQQKKEALLRDFADDALEHQKIIVNLKEKLASEKDVSKWMIAIPENRLTTLFQSLREAVGQTAVRVLKEAFQLENLQPERDIHSALVMMQEATAVAETWTAVGSDYEAYFAVGQKVMSTCKEEISRASRLLPKLRQNLQLCAQDSNYEVYIRAVPVVYQVTDRVATSVRHLSKLHSVFSSLFPLTDSISSLWKLCEPHLTVKREAEGKTKSQGRCGICLHKGAELTHEGRLYHAPCINWWVMRVEERPPSFALVT